MTAKDPEWGHPIVDHVKMGRLAKTFRIQRRVRAVDVARLMKLSKTRVYFLEIGRTAWTKKALTKYCVSVVRLQQERDNAQAA